MNNWAKRFLRAVALCLSGLVIAGAQAFGSDVRTGYAPIGPLRMYCEVHGAGEAVLLIHGAISTIDTSFGTILPELAKGRQVIALESQGHGHTADVDRPLTFAQMGDDAAALLRHLEIARADGGRAQRESPADPGRVPGRADAAAIGAVWPAQDDPV